MGKANELLLFNLMRAILNYWGHDEVTKILIRILEADLEGTSTSDPYGNDSLLLLTRRTKVRRSKRPSATNQISNSDLDVSEETKRILFIIATKFDEKRFLPSAGDIREFLILMGENSVRIADRAEAFRHLLPILARLPPEKLENLASSDRYSGPAKLGPLSEAIKSAAETSRRPEKASDSDF